MARSSSSQWKALDLGTLGGAEADSYAVAVNNSGRVVGYSDTDGGFTHAFAWTVQGGIVDLGTLGESNSRAVAVNNGGQVVGDSDTAGGFTHAFVWTVMGGMKDLGTLGGSNSHAVAVNNGGQVVGYSDTAGGFTHAFVWTEKAGMIDLGSLGGAYSRPTAVNEAGWVVGFRSAPSSHAWLWTAASGMTDLGSFGSWSGSIALDVNSVGQVVGYNRNPDLAFSWTAKGGMIGLGFNSGESSAAHAVNDAGQVIGLAGTSDVPHGAFVWTAEGGTTALGTLWGISFPTAINNAGQIVGWSELAGGEHAFMWTVEDGMVDLGTLGGPNSSANAVNKAGWAVGYAEMAYSDTVGTRTHAVIWHSPEVQTPRWTPRVPMNRRSRRLECPEPGGWLANYDVRYRFKPNSGSLRSIRLLAQRHKSDRRSFTGKAGNIYCFSARARETLGDASTWSEEACTKLSNRRPREKAEPFVAVRSSILHQQRRVRGRSG